MKYVILIITIMMFRVSAQADSPSKSFMSNSITVIGDDNNHFQTGISLDKFVKKGINSRAKKIWKKIEKGHWLLTQLTFDEMTKKKTEISFMFGIFKGRLYLYKMSVNRKKVLTGSIAIVVEPLFKNAGWK